MDKIAGLATEIQIIIDNDSEARDLFGDRDENLRALERSLGVGTSFRGGILKIKSDSALRLSQAEKVVNEMLLTVRKGGHLSAGDVRRTIVSSKEEDRMGDSFTDHIDVSSKRPHVKPRSSGQRNYIAAIRE
nr:hypothetical protein [Candidatus Omnitrophota bacterium]